MFTRKVMVLVLIGLMSTAINPAVDASPISSGKCYIACISSASTCFNNAGASFEIILKPFDSLTSDQASCKVALDLCEFSCVVVLLSPLP